MRTAAPLLLPIFRSERQADILAAVYLSAEPLTLTQVAEAAGAPYATAHREVGRLVDAGLLSERRIGNSRLLQPDDRSPYFRALRELLQTAFGPVAALAESLGALHGVTGAAIFGSYAARHEGVAGGPPEDIDVVVIGDDVVVHDLYETCRAVTAKVGREVRPVLASSDEWDHDSFFEQLRDQPLLMLFDHRGTSDES